MYISLDKNFRILAPYDFIDLLNFRVYPTNFCIENEPHIFLKRTEQKEWTDKSPNLIINQKILLITMTISNCWF
ncbi:nucleotidyltransferase family protein [Winogradskyella luteola]|uniref:nucleotidyltransferase family protein n=1 Tax=Winogradskyella luteola TaxID=2828330 RepID=UPI0034E973CE